jgi:fumarate reductase subunit C
MTQPAGDDLLYRRPISIWWWTKKRTYFVFVMRELSSIFIAWFVVYLSLFVRAIGQGETAYDDFLDRAATPGLVVVNLVAFAFLVLHLVTWFSLTPQAMVVEVRGQRVPPSAILAGQYVGLFVVSAVVFWLVLG